jgi:hypothetical protein
MALISASELALDTRKLITATMFGVAIAVLKGPFQPPYADLLIIVEAPIIGLGFLLLGRGGATYTELINGLLQTTIKASFFPFSLLVAVFYGVQVDIFSSLLRVESNGKTSAKKMFFSLGLASTITGILAAYTSIYLGIVPNNPSLFAYVYIPIVAWGVLSGAVGGALSARIWDRNLRVRFRSSLQKSTA